MDVSEIMAKMGGTEEIRANPPHDVRARRKVFDVLYSQYLKT